MVDALPLILQVQQAALDSSASLGDALLKAKVVCAKLDLVEFGKWVELETSGYPDVPFAEIPEYRKIRGTPQAHNPYHGWQDIGFADQDTFDALSICPLSTAVTTLETQVASASPDGCFEYQYSIYQQNFIREATGHRWSVRLKIDVGVAKGILDKVRLILTDWTIRLEKEGVLGDSMQFTGDDKETSARATETVINHFHMRNVGAFVQSAVHSTVTGESHESLDMSQVSNLVSQIDAQTQYLPAEIQAEIAPHLDVVKQEIAGGKDQKRIRQSLKVVGDICMKIGTSVAASGITHAIAAMLASG